MFLKCHGPSIGKRATFVFYATCLLYILCTVNFVGDLIVFIFEVSNNSTCSKKKKYRFNQFCRQIPGHLLYPLILSKQ